MEASCSQNDAIDRSLHSQQILGKKLVEPHCFGLVYALILKHFLHSTLLYYTVPAEATQSHINSKEVLFCWILYTWIYPTIYPSKPWLLLLYWQLFHFQTSWKCVWILLKSANHVRITCPTPLIYSIWQYSAKTIYYKNPCLWKRASVSLSLAKWGLTVMCNPGHHMHRFNHCCWSL